MITLQEYIDIRRGTSNDSPGVHVIPRKSNVLDEIAVPTDSGTVMIRIGRNRQAGPRVLEARICKQRNWRVSPRIKSGEWSEDAAIQIAAAAAQAIRYPVERVSREQPDGWIVSMGNELFSFSGETLHSKLEEQLRDGWKTNTETDETTMFPRRPTIRDLLFWRRMMRKEQVFTGLEREKEPVDVGRNRTIPTSFRDYEPDGYNHVDKAGSAPEVGTD